MESSNLGSDKYTNLTNVCCKLKSSSQSISSFHPLNLHSRVAAYHQFIIQSNHGEGEAGGQPCSFDEDVVHCHRLGAIHGHRELSAQLPHRLLCSWDSILSCRQVITHSEAIIFSSLGSSPIEFSGSFNLSLPWLRKEIYII